MAPSISSEFVVCISRNSWHRENYTLTGSTKYPEQFALGISSGGLALLMLIARCFPIVPSFSGVIPNEPLELKADMRGLVRRAARLG
jgi:hypothetical protein